MLDEENGNTPWMDAIKLELKQPEECNTHRSAGRNARSSWAQTDSGEDGIQRQADAEEEGKIGGTGRQESTTL